MSNGAARGKRRGFAIASLVLGILSLPTFGLVGLGAMLGIVFGVVGLVKANRAPEEYEGKGLAIAGMALCVLSVVVMPFLLGIVAAIAIPSLLRARVAANESAAIADARTVAAAETAYRSANGGLYDTLDCLAKPSACIPGYSGAALLPGRLAGSQPSYGYRRIFLPGPALASPPPRSSRSSLVSYAFVLVPLTKGQTGVRTFCVDASGRLCYSPVGSEPEPSDALCPSDWIDIDRGVRPRSGLRDSPR